MPEVPDSPCCEGHRFHGQPGCVWPSTEPAPLPRVRYRRTAWAGGYTVHHGDRLLGTIRQREQHYNLRRALVARWWEVEDVEGFNDGATYENRRHHFDRRTDAAAALIEHYGLTEEVRP